MSHQTVVGSCHCGHVRFEADLDVDSGTGKCNCTVCTKMRFWGAVVKPSSFRLLSGHSVLTDYRFNSESVHHPFCKYCGVHSFSHGNVEEVGGEFFSINLACLDNASSLSCPMRRCATTTGGTTAGASRPPERATSRS